MNNQGKKQVNQHQHTSQCCGGGCCHDHHGQGVQTCCHSNEYEEIAVNMEEKSVLLELKQYHYCPVSRFIMSSSAEKEARFVALAPVVINSVNDSLETVKLARGVLLELAKKQLISLDYDIPLQGYDYLEHQNSAAFSYFAETVEEGKQKKDFLCDTAEIEFGSIALTPLGKMLLDQIHVEPTQP